jgi:arginase
MNYKKMNIVVSGWEYGAGKSGTVNGPDALIHELQKHITLPSLPTRVEQTVEVEDVSHIYFPYLKRAKHLIAHQSRLADSLEKLHSDKPHTLLLTGDHSNAIGGMAGFCRNRNPQRVGVIWVDAHLDLHSPYTTPSGNIHGMSVNTAIEKDNLACQVNQLDTECISLWEQIKELKRVDAIPSENVVFIGIRSFEDPELQLIRDLGIQVIFAEELHAKSIEWALQEAISYLEPRTDYWYVSFDVDSMDPSISAGTGTPEFGGLDKEQAKLLLHTFWHHPNTECLEITEINPSLDTKNPMAKEVADLLLPLLR